MEKGVNSKWYLASVYVNSTAYSKRQVRWHYIVVDMNSLPSSTTITPASPQMVLDHVIVRCEPQGREMLLAVSFLKHFVLAVIL